jgi:hypothetical protein
VVLIPAVLPTLKFEHILSRPTTGATYRHSTTNKLPNKKPYNLEPLRELDRSRGSSAGIVTTIADLKTPPPRLTMLWVLRVFSANVERQDIKLIILLYLEPGLRMITAVQPLPIHLHGVQSTLNKCNQIKSRKMTVGWCNRQRDVRNKKIKKL